MMSLSLSPAASDVSDDLVKDVSLSTFMADVIEASNTQPVIVDFWATWCGPCKQLMPVLEKVVRAAKGAVRLVKIDIDKEPDIAQQMGVQSVPAVFAFHKGRPVDGFMGALPESQIKSWVERLIKATGASAPVDDGVADALKHGEDFLAMGDHATAQDIFTEILQNAPDNAAAFSGLARTLVAQGDFAGVKAMLAAAPEMAKDKSLSSVHAAIELAEQAQGGVDTTVLEKNIAANAADYQSRFDLAVALYGRGRREEAVDHLLEIVRRSRSWNEDAARKQLVKFFEAMGAMDPLTVASRKKLSSILFS